MARPIRIQYPGAVYHVMARGNHGQAVFGDHADRRRFLETLGEACEKTGWRVHAYVLLGNPYHLAMGHFTRVSQAIGQVKRRPGRKHERTKRLLSQGALQQTTP